MQIVVSITRRKVADAIIETFLITPRHNYIIDTKRKAKRVIWKLIAGKSIANRYKLLDINWQDYSVVIKLQFENKPIDFELSEQYKLDYRPILGEKRCTKCVALKIFNNQMYCRTKSKKINKNSWYKCQEWKENVEIVLI